MIGPGSPRPYPFGPFEGERDKCPCGRMLKPAMLWLCRCCYLEKEIGYAISELERGGAAGAGGMGRLRKLVEWRGPAVTAGGASGRWVRRLRPRRRR